ncbi:hypothetical protein QIU18_04935 [Capnocytophaga canimorsus]|nr:hypothetical protein [Capnocytophaga canimorsus]WGU71244.1 hypothetical protein QIU18_04935 [Capnocytophaga canimorsus]
MALTGACVEKPQYVSVIAGAQVDSVVSGNLKKRKITRYQW